MSKRILIDTNLIVRYLVQDNEKQARIAGRFFEACDRGELTIVILPVVLAECVFVLESFYAHPRPAIASALSALISSARIQIDSPAIHRDALDRFRKTKAHFVDCVIAANSAADNIAVASFDRDFRKFPDIRVETQ